MSWKTRLKRFLIKWAIALVLLLAALAWGMGKLAEWPVSDEDRTAISWTIPHGQTVSELGRNLERDGLIRHRALYRWALLFRWDRSPKAGLHTLRKTMSPVEIAQELAKPAAAPSAPLMIVEGVRVMDVDRLLVRAGLAPAGAYRDATIERLKKPLPFAKPPVESLEGYLAASTWNVPLDKVDVDWLVEEQVQLFARRTLAPFSNDISGAGRSLHEVVTLASLVEREDYQSANRPIIAGVIITRLQRGIPLGIDATSRYPLDDWTDERAFRTALGNAEDYYNSRLRPGLPPTPISTPGVDAMRAALRPQATGHLYYLHDSSGGIHLAKNAKEHEENRRTYGVR